MAITNMIAGLVTLSAVIAVFLVNYISPKFDPREPPVIKPAIPLVGHIIGMLTEGPAYFIRINKKTNHPIYSLPMLNGKAYVVASPTLAVAVQRAASTLSFEQLVADISPRLVGCSQSTFDILRDPKAKEEGRVRLVSRAHQMINPALGMSQINTIAESQFKNFTHVISQIQDGDEIELYRYLRRAILDGTTSTFFGPHNPWAVNPELNDKYWDWDDGLIGYTVGILPKITARKAYLGAEACVQGFVKYMEEGHYKDAHPMLQGRKKTHEEYGIVGSEHARMELAITFGFVTNASITTCWVANNIYSRPELLKEIREEIDSNAVEAPGVISGMKLRDACPLFNSVLRETLRLIAPMTSARAVLEDTLLADTYLLKKGNIVQISGSILHADAEIWGSDASSFNARRFIHSMNGSKTNLDGSVPDDKANLAHPAAFRAFGGGSSLCPGRHFAQMEILGLAALLLQEFDMAPPTGLDKVQWDPPKADKKFPINVMKPTRELRVKLQRRSGQDNVRWTLRM